MHESTAVEDDRTALIIKYLIDVQHSIVTLMTHYRDEDLLNTYPTRAQGELR